MKKILVIASWGKPDEKSFWQYMKKSKDQYDFLGGIQLVNQSDEKTSLYKQIKGLFKQDKNNKLTFVREHHTSFRSWIKYFILSLYGLYHSKNYDTIITLEAQLGLLIALYQRLGFFKNKKHYIWSFRINRDIGKITKFICSWIYKSVNGFIVFSSREKRYYSKLLSIKLKKFVFLLYGVDVNSESELLIHNEKFILSSGRTSRDYETLLKAIENIPVNLKIVCDYFNISELDEIPENVEVFYNIPHEKLSELIRQAYFLVVPLKNKNISAGQLAFLEAMRNGKAVIATNTIGTLDYIKHGYSGILVELGNVQELSNTILRLWNDQHFKKNIEKKALKVSNQYFSGKALSKQLEYVISGS